MEQIDLKKLETAIIYAQRIADGNNPVTNKPAEADSILNNPNVIRCMFFIRDILSEVKANNGFIGSKGSGSSVRQFPYEVLEQFHYETDKSISRVIEQIYTPVADRKIRRISGSRITEWLLKNGYLRMQFVQEFNKEFKYPTEKGELLGIRAERFEYGATGRAYIGLIYNRSAQEFIVKNMRTILEGEEYAGE